MIYSHVQVHVVSNVHAVKVDWWLLKWLSSDQIGTVIIIVHIVTGVLALSQPSQERPSDDLVQQMLSLREENETLRRKNTEVGHVYITHLHIHVHCIVEDTLWMYM